MATTLITASFLLMGTGAHAQQIDQQPAPTVLVSPIKEVKHPAYEDAAYQPVKWSDIKHLSRKTDARRVINKRKAGRTALRVLFTGAAATELYFAQELIRGRNTWGYPLLIQGGLTAVGAGALWGTMPGDRKENRAERLNQVNQLLRTQEAATQR